MTMHKALQSRDDGDRLYVSRKERGTGLASTEDSVNATIQVKAYVEKDQGILISATRINTENTRKDSKNNQETKMGRKRIR